MTLKTGRFVSKSYPVEAVEVSAKNIDAVASWCRGEICTLPSPNPELPGKKYIKVHVHLPRNITQTQAYIGNVVLYAGKGFKVYSNQAFKDNFVPVRKPPKLVNLDDVNVTQNIFPDETDPGVRLLKDIFEKPTILEVDNKKE